MRRRDGKYLILEDDGRITMAVADFDEADRVTAETGIANEDGCFDLGHVDDDLIWDHPSLLAEFKADWMALARTYEANEAEKGVRLTRCLPCHYSNAVGA